MYINKIRFINAMSFALDFLELDMLGNVTNHGRRVAMIAVNLGKVLKLSDTDIADLFVYAMLHDNGATDKKYFVYLENGKIGREGAFSHCEVGERNMSNFPFVTYRPNVIRYHHEAYDGSGLYGIKGDGIPLFSQIIALADETEIAYRKTGDRKKVLQNVSAQEGSIFSEKIIQAFRKAAGNIAFWLSLNDSFIESELLKSIPQNDILVTYQDISAAAAVISNIIDAKSPFTGRHSAGLAQKISVMCDFYKFEEEKKTKMIIAAYLHDVGKLAVPNRILDKPGHLTADEFDVLKAHPYYTKAMLSAIGGFEDIAAWAGEHHEKLNGKGYPEGLTASELSFESQLMACMDVYQAVTEERPYRKGLSHQTAVGILESMAASGELNADIVKDIGSVCNRLQTYPECTV